MIWRLSTPARLTALALAALVTVPAAAGQQTSSAGTQVFRNARLIDGNGRVLTPRGVIVVRDGRIVAVGPESTTALPSGAASIDVSGRTVMPGLVNAHGHVGDTRGLQTGQQFYTEANLVDQLRRYAAYGVTTVMSLGGDASAGFKLRDASQMTAVLDRARLRVAGPVVTAATPDAVRSEVDRVAAMKPDMIKIRVDDNLGTTTKMRIEVARAVIEQAHARDLRVAAHIFYLDDAKALVRAGVDFIAHSVRDKPVDAELIAMLKERDVCVCPTLMREVSTFVYENEPDFFSDPFFLKSADPAVLAALRDPARQAQMQKSASAQRYKAALEMASANAKRLFDAGVGLASGTDTGPPARFQGYFEHVELELLARAGLPPAAILAMATGGAATCLRLSDVGYLRPGQRADFIVLRGDPLQDVRQTRTIESVWIGARKIG